MRVILNYGFFGILHSLTSYGLETRGVLRRLGFLALDDLISNDMMLSGGLGSVYIAQWV
jgi:hypothetical protein